MFPVQIGFPPFLTIVSRLNQVTNQPFRQRELHLSSFRCLLISSQTTVLTVLDILIDWFEEHAFVPQLVSSASVLDFIRVTPQLFTFPTNYETMTITFALSHFI